MPGVNRPPNERLLQQLGVAMNGQRAGATQQQLAYTDGSGDVILNFGLIPGSNPAQYGMMLLSPGGIEVMYAGTALIPDGSGREQQVFLLFRDDGSPALQLTDGGTSPGHPHQQALQWVDRSGNIVFADDTNSAHGIANPYVPQGGFADITAPTNTTTSTSFVGMQWADAYQQHPKITATVICQTPSGTTGQVRLTVGGVQIGSAVTVPSNSFTVIYLGPAAWPSFTWLNRVIVQLEAKVTSGSGAIGVRGVGIWGVQT